MKTTSERIKEALELRGMKQSELVQKTGIGKSSISTYISGAYVPKQNNTYKIAKALDVNEAWLMGLDVPMCRTPDIDRGKDTSKKVIPVLGYVRAGIPIEAIEEIIDYEEISEEMAARGEYFALKIKGDSMEPRICDGDVVIVRQQPNVESGEIAIVLVNGDEATCKKLMKHEDGISLVSFNSVYAPMFFTPKEIEEKPVSVIGKVVELRGKF